jgi:dTDP-4-amino-4,6-dideoxygalactose transaminase
MSGEQIAFIDLAAQQRLIRDDVDRRIAAVLDHGRYIMGPEIAELEGALAVRTGARHVVSCGSGTDALVMALMALGVGHDDAVLVPSFTFAATAESVVLAGGTPAFVEVDAQTFNVDPASIASAVSAARERGLRPVGIIPVDLFGQAADYAAISRAADEHGLWVVADAAQSLGGIAPTGAVGTLASMTTTSFFPAKPLGCYGDGGAIFTDDDDLAEQLRSIRVHGQGADKYDNVRIGMNGRLDTLQAAVLLAKLEVFDDELLARQEVADRYRRAFAELSGVQTPIVGEGVRSSWAQYTIIVANGRDEVVAGAQAAGVPTAVYYRSGLHAQLAYEQSPVCEGGLPVTEELGTQVLSLPMHPYLEASQQEHIIDVIADSIRVPA